jgi:hypothetical protein
MWLPVPQSWRGEAYLVRRVPGTAPDKRYRCPGCDHEISGGTPHVVAWPAHDPDAEDRRHWHTPCWAARDRRTRGSRPLRHHPRAR